MRLVVDYSNGTASLILNDILEKLKIKFATINEEPNGNFPGHSPNPLRIENHKKLSWALKNSRYKLGALIDGDGDRIVFFDEVGQAISPAHIFAILVSHHLQAAKRFKNVAITASFSKVIEDVAHEYGGKVHISPVGRTNLSPVMKRNHSLLGAELSGHYFFKDFFYQDNAVLALLGIIKILNKEKKPLSKLVERYNVYITLPEFGIDRIEGTEKEALRAVREAFPGGRVSRIDGLTIEYTDWWFNLRASNTQDLWRLTLEGEDKDLLNEKQMQIERIVKSLPKREVGIDNE